MKLSKVKELLQKLDAEAKKTNKAFAKASKAQKRVMVLEDALKQLRRGKYKAERGTYFHVRSNGEELENDGVLPEERSWDGSVLAPELHEVADENVQLKALIDLPVAQCTVCAIGGAFASIVLLQDKLKKGKIYSGHGCDLDWHEDRYMTSVFPSNLLHKMELAFESNEFGYEQDSDEDRLKAIYRNIIKNGGKAFTYAKRIKNIWYLPDSQTGGPLFYTSKDVIWSERGKRP